MKDFFVVYKVRMVRPAVANVNTQADEPHTKPGQRSLPTVAPGRTVISVDALRQVIALKHP